MPLNQVLSEIRQAEQQAGRSAGSARLVVVSKGQSLASIEEHILTKWPELPADGKLRRVMLAENRGQELRDKVREAETAGWPQRFDLEWHFIGPLQRNKIKYLQPVSLVHTLEAAWQAEMIAEAAEGWGRAPAVLLQLHNGETQKHGAEASELKALYHTTVQTGLEVRGVMVMAPYGDPAAAQRVFALAAQQAADLGLSELSMGMSDDFELALQQGATLLRIGRRLFS